MDAAPVILRDGDIVLRPALADDIEDITRIRSEAEIVRWWGRPQEGEVERDAFGSRRFFVIEVTGEVIGGIQYDEEEDPMYRHANIDIYLATGHHGRGIGSAAIRILARYLFEQRNHHRLTIDPAADNAPAIRAYEKAGFRRIGIMREYELGPDGRWRDGLLMDMLRRELTGEPRDGQGAGSGN